MKTNIHPKWYEDCKVACACGNTFVIGATVASMDVEVCYNCHPFYTGQMKYVDTAGRVDAFVEKIKNAKSKVISKTEKRKLKKAKKIEKELSRPDTLADLRKLTSKKSKKKANKAKK